jgi:UDP-glucose 4-epimerase
MILVTGHRGFIGSHLTKQLIDGTWVGLDIKEGQNLLTCDLPKDVTLIYHLAAQSQVEPSWHDPLNDLDNIRMTARLVKEYPYARIIYANSCASMNVSSPYGFSKKMAGEYLKTFHEDYVSLVFPNIYGPGSHSVVDIFKGKHEVPVFGSGEAIRDYVHVYDLIEGMVKASAWPIGEYFMGSGKGTSVLELAKHKEIQFLPPRKEDHEVIVPNTTPDWKPEIDVLEYIK